jgi:hypothetical protein
MDAVLQLVFGNSSQKFFEWEVGMNDEIEQVINDYLSMLKGKSR